MQHKPENSQSQLSLSDPATPSQGVEPMLDYMERVMMNSKQTPSGCMPLNLR